MCMMAGYINRILYPGCKFDYCLVLQSRQGIGKGKFLSRLATFAGECYHTGVTDIVNKPRYIETVMGKLIVEIPEAIALKNADSSVMKETITATKHNYRQPYAPKGEDIPVGHIFVVTTNENECLKDTSGNRRYLNVPCGTDKGFTIDDAELDRNFEQIMAEAMTRTILTEEFKLIMPKEYEDAIAARQDGALQKPVTLSKITPYLESKACKYRYKEASKRKGHDYGSEFCDEDCLVTRKTVHLDEIAKEVYCKNTEDLTPVQIKQIRQSLKLLSDEWEFVPDLYFGARFGKRKKSQGWRLVGSEDIKETDYEDNENNDII